MIQTTSEEENNLIMMMAREIESWSFRQRRKE